jgi:hypothetical protein
MAFSRFHAGTLKSRHSLRVYKLAAALVLALGIQTALARSIPGSLGSPARGALAADGLVDKLKDVFQQLGRQVGQRHARSFDLIAKRYYPHVQAKVPAGSRQRQLFDIARMTACLKVSLDRFDHDSACIAAPAVLSVPVHAAADTEQRPAPVKVQRRQQFKLAALRAESSPCACCLFVTVI